MLNSQQIIGGSTVPARLAGILLSIIARNIKHYSFAIVKSIVALYKTYIN